MTMRNLSLTAVAALTVALAGGAMAQQDTATVPAPSETAQSDVQNTVDSAADAVTQEAQDAATTVTDAADGNDAQAADATEAEAEATAEAVTEEAAAEAPAQDAAATEAAAAEQPDAAGEGAADAYVNEQPATTADDDTAVEVSTDEETQMDGTTAETAVEEESAQDPSVAETSDVESDEHAAEGSEDHAEGEAAAGHGGGHVEDVSFSFEGPFGKYDQFQLQRGLQVYTEVCSSCHGLRYVPLRTLADEGGPGLPADQVRAYAAEMDITDAETGEDRPRLPTDHFPTVPHVEGTGPDLSLMAKARAGFHGPLGTGLSQLFNGIGGPEYIHAILTGYTGETKEEAGTTFYENTAFSTGWIAMPPPLSDDLVTYEDGTAATEDQMSMDIAAFLTWTAEPKMMDRKQVGLVSVLFLIVLSVLLYLTNKRLWAPHKGKKKH